MKRWLPLGCKSWRRNKSRPALDSVKRRCRCKFVGGHLRSELSPCHDRVSTGREIHARDPRTQEDPGKRRGRPGSTCSLWFRAAVFIFFIKITRFNLGTRVDGVRGRLWKPVLGEASPLPCGCCREQCALYSFMGEPRSRGGQRLHAPLGGDAEPRVGTEAGVRGVRPGRLPEGEADALS